MKLIQVIITCAVIFIVTAAPANAELIFNDRTEDTQEIVDEYGCAGENLDATFFVHEKLTFNKRGGYSYHYNIDGIMVGQETSREWIWREVFNDTVAIANSDTFRGTLQHRIAIIGKGQQLDFWLKFKLHLVVNSGQVVSSFNSFEVVCTE